MSLAPRTGPDTGTQLLRGVANEYRCGTTLEISLTLRPRDEEIEAQSGEGISPRSHSEAKAEPELEP